jgi:hypothetical protein
MIPGHLKTGDDWEAPTKQWLIGRMPQRVEGMACSPFLGRPLAQGAFQAIPDSLTIHLLGKRQRG